MTRPRTPAFRRDVWLPLAATVLGLGIIAGAVACGDDAKKTTTAATAAPTKASADVQAIHQVFLTAIERWNTKDLEGFAANFTDKGFVSSFGDDGQTAADLAQVKSDFQGFFGSQPLKNPKFSQESISGDVGTMDVVFQLGPMLVHSKFTLAKNGVAWKLDGEESDLPVDVPAGVTAINVDLNEFAFGVDTSQITATKGFALVANNVGKQGHELAIASIPDGVAVSDVVQGFATSDGAGVPGVEFIAGTGAEPGQKRNLVFTEPLAAGRYLMICFRPDTAEAPDGTPHAVKGMVKDFSVE